MVSMEATPVKAPPVVTFNPPVLVKAKVPLALPTAIFPVPVVPKLSIPDPLGATVKFWFDVVERVAALPLPKFKAVAVIPSVAEEVSVVREEAVRLVAPLNRIYPLDPLLGVRIMFPVVLPPKVKFWN